MNTNRTLSTIVSVVVVLLVILGIYYWASSPDRTGPDNYDSGQSPTDETSTDSPLATTKAATFITRSTVVLNGEVNPRGAQTSYWYEYGETNSMGSFSSPQLIGGGNIAYSAPKGITGLKTNTTYYYRLVAENEYGKTSGETMQFTTSATATPISFVSPAIVTKNATAITPNSVVLNGSVNANGPAASYWFEYGKTFGLGNITPVTAASASTTTIQVATPLTNLQTNTTYYYRLNAQNVYGTINGNISVFTTLPATPVTPPLGKLPTVSTSAVTNLTSTTARLSGQINPNGSATTYSFRYGESTPFGRFDLNQKTPNAQAGQSTSTGNFAANLSELKPGTTYYYQLIAENQYGTGSGAIFSFTTLNP